MSEHPRVDRAGLAATTEEDIRRHAIEDGEDPDAPLAQFHLVIPVHAIRKKLGMTQEAFADLLMIPIGTIRNWEQNRSSRIRLHGRSNNSLSSAKGSAESPASGLNFINFKLRHYLSFRCLEKERVCDMFNNSIFC